MVTVAGTFADGDELDRVTIEPPVGAAALIVIVPVELLLPTIVAGSNENPLNAIGLIVKAAFADVTEVAAVILSWIWEGTDSVVTVNVAEVVPAPIVIDPGTVAAALLLDKLMLKPPAGAGLPIVTVAALVAPPIKVEGSRVRPVTAGGFTNKLALTLDPEMAAVMTVVVELGTPTVAMEKLPDAAPAGIVKVGGTDAAD